MDLFGHKRKQQEEQDRLRYEEAERQREMIEERQRFRQWAKSLERSVFTIGYIVTGRSNNNNEQIHPYVWERNPDSRRVDMNQYIKNKPNSNVLVCGASGQGKSKLMRHLLKSFVGYKKIIFSMKHGDEYTRMGYPAIDVTMLAPNPFQNLETFTSAFAITFPIDTVGITASQVPALVRDMARGCNDWDDFLQALEKRMRETKDKIQLSALYFIQEQIKSVVVATTSSKDSFASPLSLLQGNLSNGNSIVIDLSTLNDSAKIFYSELLLRQIWEDLKSQSIGDKTLVCIDEAHRLTRGSIGRYRTIIHEMAREIRERGALWTSTQNYTDLDDSIRNQFESQLVFRTTSKADLDALRTIHPTLAYVASIIQDHAFFDAKYKELETKLLIFYYHPCTASFGAQVKIHWVMEQDEPVSTEEYLSTTKAITPTLQSKKIIDYEAIIKDKIKQEPIWISGIASYFSDKYGIDKDAAKLKVKDILQKLVNADEVQRMKFDMVSGETVVLYFRKSDNESPLHRWMIRQVLANCDQDDAIIHVASSGEALPDVELSYCFVECETSLKKRTDDLEQRVAKFSSDKPMIILVPNRDAEESYERFASDRVIVTTLKNFNQSIRTTKARP